MSLASFRKQIVGSIATPNLSIEELLIRLAMFKIHDSWDANAIRDMKFQIGSGIGFTQKQANLAIALLNKYKQKLDKSFKTDVDQYIKSPYYKILIRAAVIKYPKRMFLQDNDQYKKVILVQFPYNKDLVNQINKFKTESSDIIWDKPKSSWVFPLNEDNLLFLYDIADRQNFQIDEKIDDYFSQISNIVENIGSLVPMLVLDQDGYATIANLSEYAVNISRTKDLTGAIFQSRKLGVRIWCDEIKKHVDQLNPTVRRFVNSEPNKPVIVDSKKYELELIADIIQNMMPCIVSIGQKPPLETLKMCHDFLKMIGVKNSEITVTYRLDGTTRKDFNEYVKSNKLNSTINQETKIVFIGEKLPKPLIKSGIIFNSALCFDISSISNKSSIIDQAMNSLARKYIRNIPNVIYYS
jgi:ribosomal protein S17E